MLSKNSLVGSYNFGMCGVRGKIFFEELEVVFNALFGTVLEGNRNLDVVISFIPVESK